MKLLAFLLCLAFFSCIRNMPASVTEMDIRKTPTYTPLMTINGVKVPSIYSNDSLWEKIIDHPDSVPINFNVNGHLQALLIFSGKLYKEESYEPEKIKVVLPNGQHQDLLMKGSVLIWDKGQKLPYYRTDDVNFDGNNDLLIFDNAGAVNYWYSAWVYKTGRGFLYNRSVSQTVSIKTISANKQLLSYYESGYCNETLGYFEVKNDKTVPVKYIYNQMINVKSSTGCQKCETFLKEKINGRWKAKKLGEWDSTIYDSLFQMQVTSDR